MPFEPPFQPSRSTLVKCLLNRRFRKDRRSKPRKGKDRRKV